MIRSVSLIIIFKVLALLPTIKDSFHRLRNKDCLWPRVARERVKDTALLTYSFMFFSLGFLYVNSFNKLTFYISHAHLRMYFIGWYEKQYY